MVVVRGGGGSHVFDMVIVALSFATDTLLITLCHRNNSLTFLSGHYKVKRMIDE